MSLLKGTICAGDPGEAIASSPGLVGSVTGGPPGGEAAHSGGRVVCGHGRSRRVCGCDSQRCCPTQHPLVEGWHSFLV